MTIRRTLTFLLLNICTGYAAHAQTAVAGTVVRKGTVRPKTAAAAVPYSVGQLTGKWQETKRTAVSSGKRLSFTDTLQLDFNKRDSVITRNGDGMSRKGFAAVKEFNTLEAAGDTYSIVSLNKNTVVINDGEFIRQLQKKKLFYHETLGRTVIPKENLSDPEPVNVKKIIGKWDVYRTQATPGAAETDSALIKHLSFSQVNEDGSVSGEINFSKSNLTQTLPFNALFNKGTLQITTADHTWDLITYKADGKEFVFGHHGGLVYFAKQL